MKYFIIELYRRNPALTIAGLLNIGLFIVGAVLTQFDSRVLLGINIWVKPMKFSASFAITTLSFAWIIHYVSHYKRVSKFIAWGIVLTLSIEIVCIWGQSARGVTSHFNFGSAFDGMVFGIMGIAIAIFIVLNGILLILLFRKIPKLPLVYLWGIRLGLLLFILGALEGSVMIINSAHTVGLPDGGLGLKFLNWSIKAGDLRIAHFVGMHALQILPLTGYLISRWKNNQTAFKQLGYLATASLIYVVTFSALFLQAMNGNPLISG